MAVQEVPAVDCFEGFLQQLLDRARKVKQTTTVDPPLNKPDLAELFEKLPAVFPPATSAESKKHAIETAARHTFNNLLASTSIEHPEFVDLWNLLDILSILSDDEQTEPGLLFWLVEELLDSQTVAGCRKIFDYLESRRERITAKHFGSKNLVILRSCNELLRRLSRAEDTAFCGRVFIFLFQSFPLGDKSSVNLRGEYHTENVTTFDSLPAADDEKMEVDSESKPSGSNPKDSNGTTKKSTEEGKGVSFSKLENPMSADRLYPMFWSLQQMFSQPKKLFDQANFAGFKTGIEATMVMFKDIQTVSTSRTTKISDENKRGIKRKRGEEDDDLANAFNPKYLTSRDLFELEISDLSFRRHILVQVLIILDFLLSLSTRAKEKLSKASLPENANKSVMYADQVLSEEDTKWALDMKRSVAEYLKQGNEGPFFYRMVETVLSRDKNWARWKIENCPSIARPAVTPSDLESAQSKAGNFSKRFRPSSDRHLKLDFLPEGEVEDVTIPLKAERKYRLPDLKIYKNAILEDVLEIEMPASDDTLKEAQEGKVSKSWRALRMAGSTKLSSLDKVESSEKIDEIFKDNIKMPQDTAHDEEETSLEQEEVVFPKDRRPLVISGPSGVGKGTLVKMLMDKHPKVLGKKASHTTRAPREGEIHGQHYFFVSKEQYDVMRDGDQFLEYNNFNGNDYGTSRKVLEGIIAQGKVPIMEMDYHGIQQLKDNGYSARFIFLAPPEVSDLERRLQKRGLDTPEKIQERLVIAKEELEHAKIEGFHDTTFVNDDLDKTFKELESYVFGFDMVKAETPSVVVDDGENGALEEGKADVEMTNGYIPAVEEDAALKTENPTPDESKEVATTETKAEEATN